MPETFQILDDAGVTISELIETVKVAEFGDGNHNAIAAYGFHSRYAVPDHAEKALTQLQAGTWTRRTYPLATFLSQRIS